MVDPTGVAGAGGLGSTAGAARGATGAAQGRGGFAEVLRSSIEEVARLQEDASRAVEELAAGRTEDLTGVIMAVEKADIAFKTLLAIRTKLMDAYEEIKNIPL